jgi:hypothetical protein
MKTRSILFSTLCSLILGMSMTSCDDEFEEFGEDPDEVTRPHFNYVLNEGLWGANNANISGFYMNVTSPSQEISTTMNAMGDLYLQKNGKKMGDVANGMVEEDNKIYVVMNGSKYVAKLDLYCKEEARYTFSENEGEPRCIEVEDGYVYVTQYGGKLTKINASDMTLADTFEGGDNLEGVLEKDGKLYVSNSYKVDGSGNWVYNDEMFIIDAKTMKLEKTIKVALNPTYLYEFHDKIYLLSQGDYENVPGVLQVINTESGQVKSIPQTENVNKVTEGDNKLLYCVRSTYDENWNPVNSFFICNTKDDEVSETSFLAEVPEALKSANIYFLEMDEETGFLYIGTTDYTNTGTIYQFDKNGKFIQSFDSGGINPSAMIFID